MRRTKPAPGGVAKANARMKVLEARLHGLGAIVVFRRLTERTRVAIIVERDGWETLGVAHTQGADVEAIGKAAALEDACGRLGSGRFYAGNELGR